MRARLACYLSGHVRKSGHRCLAGHRTEVCRCLLVRNDISAHSLHLDAARCALSGAEHTVKSEFARSAGTLRDPLRLLHTWPHYSCFISSIPELKQAHTAAQLPRVQSRRSKLLTFEVFAVDRLAYKFERNRVPGQTTANGFYMHGLQTGFLLNVAALLLITVLESGSAECCLVSPKNGRL